MRELDHVRLLSAVTGDDAQCVPAGTTGTVVGIYAGGEAFEVEFTRPVDTLATVDGRAGTLVARWGVTPEPGRPASRSHMLASLPRPV
ncbi:DUF4926 domain-containing protein [Methylobacterium radiodurans]|uniref:DUF4926 domain-containing protein n=1 Tax=Methylobacterium radiodurans TaxID=2202828 RepID=A0A2U8VZ15_9HYPH|nr:DUF4926 domain-containing protein [Methylobacterium radiodurans]